MKKFAEFQKRKQDQIEVIGSQETEEQTDDGPLGAAVTGESARVIIPNIEVLKGDEQGIQDTYNI